MALPGTEGMNAGDGEQPPNWDVGARLEWQRAQRKPGKKEA